jgi:hypothetical protein
MEIVKLNKDNINNFCFEIPNIQRIHDKEKVSEICEYQIEYFKKHSRFNFLGVMIVNTINRETFFIIDGQHRYLALKKLIDANYCPEIFIQLCIIDTEEELRANYNIVNQNTPLPQFPENTDKNLVEDTYTHFLNKYDKMFKTSLRPQRPFVNKVIFQEAIAFISNKFAIQTQGPIIKLIEDFNSMISEWDPSNYPRTKTITPKMLKLCEENKFFLGLYTGKMVDYCYDWVREMVKFKTGEILKSSSSSEKEYKKKKIPPVKRKKIWENYIGNKASDVCTCCRETEISMLNYDCGHIVAESEGGTLEISNLRPICKSCNSSMGTTNMKEYMKIHYPNNLSYFDRLKMNFFV